MRLEDAEREIEESGKPWEKGSGDDSKGEGMKRCPSCKWKNPKGATKCKKCKGTLAKKGDAKLKSADDKKKVEEASVRGTVSRAVKNIKRLPDGTFAPEGLGTVLHAGDSVSVQRGKTRVRGTVLSGRTPRGAVRVKLSDGPAVINVESGNPDSKLVSVGGFGVAEHVKDLPNNKVLVRATTTGIGGKDHLKTLEVDKAQVSDYTGPTKGTGSLKHLPGVWGGKDDPGKVGSITKTITRDLPDGSHVRVTAERREGHPRLSDSFAVTVDGWEKRGNRPGSTRARMRPDDPDFGGAAHDEALRAAPELAPLVRMHLADPNSGEPMHAVANGWYAYSGDMARHDAPYDNREGLSDHERAARYLRVDPSELPEGMSKDEFVKFVDETLRPRWKQEAAEATALLQGVGGGKDDTGSDWLAPHRAALSGGGTTTLNGYTIHPKGDGKYVLKLARADHYDRDKESRSMSLDDALATAVDPGITDPVLGRNRDVTSTLQDSVNFGGERLPRGQVHDRLMRTAMGQGKSEREARQAADAWMQGYDRRGALATQAAFSAMDRGKDDTGYPGFGDPGGTNRLTPHMARSDEEVGSYIARLHPAGDLIPHADRLTLPNGTTVIRSRGGREFFISGGMSSTDPYRAAKMARQQDAKLGNEKSGGGPDPALVERLKNLGIGQQMTLDDGTIVRRSLRYNEIVYEEVDPGRPMVGTGARMPGTGGTMIERDPEIIAARYAQRTKGRGGKDDTGYEGAALDRQIAVSSAAAAVAAQPSGTQTAQQRAAAERAWRDTVGGKDDTGTGGAIAAAKRVAKNRQAEVVGGVLLDAQTAWAIQNVAEKLNPENRKRFDRLPIDRAGEVAWKLTTGKDDPGNDAEAAQAEIEMQGAPPQDQAVDRLARAAKEAGATVSIQPAGAFTPGVVAVIATRPDGLRVSSLVGRDGAATEWDRHDPPSADDLPDANKAIYSGGKDDTGPAQRLGPDGRMEPIPRAGKRRPAREHASDEAVRKFIADVNSRYTVVGPIDVGKLDTPFAALSPQAMARISTEDLLDIANNSPDPARRAAARRALAVRSS